MSRPVNIALDTARFKSEYPTDANFNAEAMFKRLYDLHKVYDEVQGYATLILEKGTIDNRYLALKYIAGAAVAIGLQEDRVIDDFRKYGAYKSAFWDMMKFEQDLRKDEKGLLSDAERKSLENRLRRYSKSNPKMIKACIETGRIGTSILYPMMAIMHTYKTKTLNDEFKKFVIDFCKSRLDIDVTPENMENLKAFSKEIFKPAIKKGDENENQQCVIDEKIITSIFNDMIETEISENIIENKPETLQKEELDKALTNNEKPNEYNSVFDENPDEIVETIKKSSQDKDNPVATQRKQALELAKNQKLISSEQFLQYAKQLFLSEEDYSNIDLNRCSISVTTKISGQICNEDEVKPFEGLIDKKDIQNKFMQLEPLVQNMVIKHLYTTNALLALNSDVQNFEKLDTNQQAQVADICKNDEFLNFKVARKQKQILKDKNAAIRMLDRISRKYNFKETDTGRNA